MLHVNDRCWKDELFCLTLSWGEGLILLGTDQGWFLTTPMRGVGRGVFDYYHYCGSHFSSLSGPFHPCSREE
jgi:hypothetical protein